MSQESRAGRAWIACYRAGVAARGQPWYQSFGRFIASAHPEVFAGGLTGAEMYAAFTRGIEWNGRLRPYQEEALKRLRAW